MLLATLLQVAHPLLDLQGPADTTFRGPPGGACTWTVDAPKNARRETRTYDEVGRVVESRVVGRLHEHLPVGSLEAVARYTWRDHVVVEVDYTTRREGEPHTTTHLVRRVDGAGRLLSWSQRAWTAPDRVVETHAEITWDATGWAEHAFQDNGNQWRIRGTWEGPATFAYTWPSGLRETWIFDAPTRPIRRTSGEPRGYDYTYTYDAAGRLVEEHNRGALARAWTWRGDRVVRHVFAETNGAVHEPVTVDVSGGVATCPGEQGTLATFRVEGGCGWSHEDWKRIANDCTLARWDEKRKATR
ncbi:MAG: hypothetical protein ACK4YP_20350 [Myxococcota bacterium]